MKRLIAAGVLAAVAAGHANAALAMLVRQYMGQSVTGQTVVVCVYSYNGREVHQAQRMGTICQPSIQVE